MRRGPPAITLIDRSPPAEFVSSGEMSANQQITNHPKAIRGNPHIDPNHTENSAGGVRSITLSRVRDGFIALPIPRVQNAFFDPQHDRIA
jgi:hypothetical protein